MSNWNVSSVAVPSSEATTIERRENGERRASTVRLWSALTIGCVLGLMAFVMTILELRSVKAEFSDYRSYVQQRFNEQSAVINSSAAMLKAETLPQELGLFPPQLLRAAAASVVELNTNDTDDRKPFGTAVHLGDGYFITVMHGVMNLYEPQRKKTKLTVNVSGKDVAFKVIDHGDAPFEVHSGDWAIIKAQERVDLPKISVDLEYSFKFGDAFARIGNDYSQGIVPSIGIVGQLKKTGLVTALTDAHPGVSGGAVISPHGDLIGIPIGRMQGDYRFSFMLPVRQEMFKRVPNIKIKPS
jgi:S1-C subfamily serine protease